MFSQDFLKDNIEKFLNSSHSSLHDFFGAHFYETKGVVFRVWAPSAKKLSVIGSFNNWNENKHVLEKVHPCGIWQIFIKNLKTLHLYKYHIVLPDGKKQVKADPFAFFTELRPHNSSYIYDVDNFVWDDFNWMEKRKCKNSYSTNRRNKL